MDLAQECGRLARRTRAQAKWVMRARFNDYLVAGCATTASLPLVGRYLEPVGGLTVLGLCGRGYVSDLVSMAAARRRVSPTDRLRDRESAASLMTEGLRGIVAPESLSAPWPAAQPGVPWRNAGRHRRSVIATSVRYGRSPEQVLDVWRRRDLTGPAPVMLFVPGGAWVVGRRELQGHTLMAQLAEQGWVCLSMQYRTSPRHRWPRHIMDVKAAVAWARAHAGQFGGDTGFVAVAGCSAGGHLASLIGLTADDPQWDSELDPQADTSVDAVVSLYGRYDWEDRSTPERARFMEFLERVIVQRRQSDRPAVFHDATPTHRVRSDAPPFLVIHGSDDAIIPVAEARRFVSALRGVSRQAVGYVELPGAGHGFDLLDAGRTHALVQAVTLFLNQAHTSRPVVHHGAAV
jgi:acetyl esterase/lipase